MKAFHFCVLAILPLLLASSAFGLDEGITPELQGSSKVCGLNAETKTEKDELFQGFRNPPPVARPYVFWIWISGNITRSGITADLEAMASAGIGGASIFNLGGSHGVEIPPGPVAYMSAQWLDLINFAASEAKRLGLTLGMENCAGWATMGGPWIKPEHGSQQLVSTTLNIEGGRPIVRQLPRPETRLDYYRDIAILAYPTPKDETYQLPSWSSKAAQRGWRLGQQPDLTARPTDAAIPVRGIVDLIRQVDAEGKLTWDAPDGKWTILRLGHTPMGTQNFPDQPFDDSVVPGMTFGQWGSHFDRNTTWFKPGKAWFSYLSRSQFLLQYGDFAADVLCFAGEASPNGGVNGGDIKNAGFDYDVCGTDIFAKLEAVDGNIVVPCGRQYRLLVMPPTPFQSPQVIRKVRDLVAAGATILSTRPKHSPTLAGFPESQELVLALASQLWGECNGTTIQSNRHGKGRIFDGLSPANVLRELGIQPAVQLPKAVSWIHRRTQDTDIFFLANSSKQTVCTIAGFRATGRKPEFFDAELGSMTDASGWTVDGDYVRVPLKLEPEKSVFVVFRHPAQPHSDPYVSGTGPDGEPLDFDGSVAPRFPALPSS